MNDVPVIYSSKKVNRSSPASFLSLSSNILLVENSMLDVPDCDLSHILGEALSVVMVNPISPVEIS
jgi:hypothetical protein